eukprot:964909-Prorocentrum_minimum.AAC.1
MKCQTEKAEAEGRSDARLNEINVLKRRLAEKDRMYAEGSTEAETLRTQVWNQSQGGEAVYTQRAIGSQEGRQYIPSVRTNRREGRQYIPSVRTNRREGRQFLPS